MISNGCDDGRARRRARGVGFGDRVATLAWNAYRHMELYYAASVSGAELHTLNPRLHPDQVAWIAYPMLARWLGLDPLHAGLFLGGTIHDVAQLVGAGYSMSKEAGGVATVVKLMRVAMLLPMIVFAVAVTRSRFEAEAARPPLLPGFALGFAALVALGSTGWITPALVSAGGDLSRWRLVSSIAAIGMKTHLQEVASVGIKPVILMLGETVFLALLVLAMLLAMLRWAC